MCNVDVQKISGIYNLTNSGVTTWYGFATSIKKRWSRTDSDTANIIPITSSEYNIGTFANRPKNSQLSNKKFETVFHISLPAWFDILTYISAR